MTRDSRDIRDCGRTAGLIDRLVAETVTAEDREHAATCPSCGPVLARAARFDAELGRAARSLIVEELPRDILDPALDGGAAVPRVRPRRALPGLGSLAATIAILLVATAVALVPGGPDPSGTPGATQDPIGDESPPASVGPTIGPIESLPSSPRPGTVFRRTTEIVLQAVDLGYRCNDGGMLKSMEPGPSTPVRESAVCSSPEDTSSYSAVIIVGESAANEVVAVWIKAIIHGEDGTPVRDNVAIAVARLAQLALASTDAGLLASEFVLGHLPGLDPGTPAVRGDAGYARLTLERDAEGNYLLTVVPRPAG
jgi:hypothetical protein